MKNTTISEIIAENNRRNEALGGHYDPITGEGAWGNRIAVTRHGATLMLPESLLTEADVSTLSDNDFEMLRIKHDFEYWCARCVTIKDKVSSRNVKFILNAPQRRLTGELETMRLANAPIRLIMLKARQWGGSTLVQVYMAWIQIVHRQNWNSLICGHLRDTAATIQGMYAKILRQYPEEYWHGDEPLRFRPFEKSRNVSEIVGRSCCVVAGTAGSQESVRGMDIAMAHLTEVAFWPSTQQKSPESVVRSVCGSVMLEPLTVIVMESTANGMGNFFHAEWLRSKSGFSDKRAFFVPWYEIEIYRRKVTNAQRLWQRLDDYERDLWHQGLTLEMIAWYHAKRKEYNSHSQMKAEYPTNDIEAFANSGSPVFNSLHLNILRSDCTKRIASRYEFNHAPSGAQSLKGLQLVSAPDTGNLWVWTHRDQQPNQPRNRYVVAVDVGGMSDKADFSVITVFDRLGEDGKVEVVAQWRGHTYHDRLAWLAAQVAKWYNNALLVIESNSLETEFSEGDGSEYVLSLIHNHYSNLYRRENNRFGFHTNKESKAIAVFNMIGMVRDHSYVERCGEAIDEMNWFEHKPHGAFGAIKGRHDDMVMTRAIGLLIANQLNTRMQNRQDCNPEMFRDPVYFELAKL